MDKVDIQKVHGWAWTMRNAEDTALKLGRMALAAKDWDYYRQLLRIHAYWRGSVRYWQRHLEAKLQSMADI